MKTLTEFPGLNLKLALKLKNELVSAGKTPDELPQALGEALKLEGDRLSYLTIILDLIDSKSADIKRAIVFSLNEGEKAPPHASQKGDHYFLLEYYPPLQEKNPKQKMRGNKSDNGKRKKGPRGRRGPPQSDKRSEIRTEKRPVAAKSTSPSIAAQATPSSVVRRVIKPKI